MSLGVWISMKPRACSASRNRLPTAAWSLKMAWLAGVRRSSTRLSSRVSGLTFGKGLFSASTSASDRLASSRSNGSDPAARLTQRTVTAASS